MVAVALLFDAVKKELGERNIIAEDLGYLTPAVNQLVEDSGYPGMKVLQFAFDSREDSDYLPHNYCRNCVVYTGTHDNDTIMGWMDTAAPQEAPSGKGDTIAAGARRDKDPAQSL